MSSSEHILSMLSALRTDFLDSLHNRCTELEQWILKLTGKSRNCSEFEEIYRIVHSIKGAGGTHGLPLVTSICHYFEDLLTSQRITTFAEDFADQAFQLVDMLRELSVSSNDLSKINEIEKKLELLRNIDKQYLGSVLVLEPSKVTRLLLQHLLEKKQFKATFVPDNIEALQRLLIEPFDLIIISVELNFLKGPALISAIQTNGGLNAQTSVLFLTSQTEYYPEFIVGAKVFRRSPLLTQQLEQQLKEMIVN